MKTHKTRFPTPILIALLAMGLALCMAECFLGLVPPARQGAVHPGETQGTRTRITFLPPRGPHGERPYCGTFPPRILGAPQVRVHE